MVKLLLTVLITLSLATPAKAAMLELSTNPYYWTLDHTSFGTVAGDSGTRSFGVKAVYGSLATLNLGPNVLELVALSAGIGVTGSDADNPTNVGGQLGIVPICGPGRMLCLDITLQRDIPNSSNRYLILLLGRLSALPEALK